MRALAEYVMRGRPQAIGVSVLAAPLPLLHLLSTSIVSLVTLRKGAAEGGLVLAWTCLPLAAVYMLVGDPSPFFTLFGTVALAWILRATVAWQWVAGLAVPIAIAGALAFSVMASDMLDMWVQLYLEVVGRGLEAEISAEDARHVVIGFFAMGQAWVMLGLLALARWWQSHLYNPGGFGSEFRGLRLSPQASAAVVLIMVGCAASNMPMFSRWLPVLTVPMAISALGLVHWALAYKKLTGAWVAAFYLLLLLLFQLIYPLLVATALMDSWFDIRKRFQDHKD